MSSSHQLNLWRSSSVQLAIRAAAAIGILTSIPLLGLWLMSNSYIDSQQEDLLQQDANELLEAYQQTSTRGLTATINIRLSNPLKGRHYLLLNSLGHADAGDLLTWEPESDFSFDGSLQYGWLESSMLPTGQYGDDMYAMITAHTLPNEQRLMVVQILPDSSNWLAYQEEILEWLGPLFVSITLTFMVVFVISRRLLRRMALIQQTAKQIMDGDLNQRIPVNTDAKQQDEFDQLSIHLNDMLARIEQLVAGVRAVTDNVAHDLRSPLTRMRNRIEVTLLEPRSKTEYHTALEQTITDVEGLLQVFNALLSIAQAEAGNQREHWQTIDLEELISDIIDLYRPIAESKQQQLQWSPSVAPHVHGNRDLLAQAIGNVLENAIKYTPEQGNIAVQINLSSEHLLIHITDTGPGIAPNDRERVFTRFTRLHPARHLPGNGLGLSLAQAVIRLHGGDIQLTDNCAAKGTGLTVTLTLPTKGHNSLNHDLMKIH